MTMTILKTGRTSVKMDNRSAWLWLGVLFFTLAGVVAGVELGQGGIIAFLGGLVGAVAGFCIGILGAQWALRR